MKENDVQEDPQISVSRRDSIAYHFEYTNIHNQRIALVRRTDLWHQISFPSSLVVFAFVFNLASQSSDWKMFLLAALTASAIALFGKSYAQVLDKRVVELYPRIITLELVLGYRFYRHYLKLRGNTERRFVEQCEEVDLQKVNDLWEKVLQLFDLNDFQPSKRLLHRLNLAAWVLVFGFWLAGGGYALAILIN